MDIFDLWKQLPNLDIQTPTAEPEQIEQHQGMGFDVTNTLILRCGEKNAPAHFAYRYVSFIICCTITYGI